MRSTSLFLAHLGAASALALCALAPASGAHECSFPITPGLIEHVQPDGSRVSVHGRGTGRVHWFEDDEGYPLVIADGALVYARLDADGTLLPSEHLVGRGNPAALGFAAHVRPARAMGSGPAPTPAPGTDTGAMQRGGGFALTTGSAKNLVVLIRWNDHGPTGQNRTLPSTTNVGILMNQPGGHPTIAPTGSVRDFYLENSYGQLSIDSTVRDWVTVSMTESWTANGVSGDPTRLSQALTEALAAVDATTNFSTFDADADGWIDAITILHSGYGAEFGGNDQYGTPHTNRIWSRKGSIPVWTSAEGVKVADYHMSPALWSTSGSAPGHIGVVCHELGHFFGLPDLYDADASSAGTGQWCLMGAGAWGFGGDQLRPSHFGAWGKVKLGWVDAIDARPGTLTLPAVETSPTIYRLQSGYPAGEYLLLENRQPAGIETQLPAPGLAVWHIDDKRGVVPLNNVNTREGFPAQAGWPTNGNHYRVALLQADGAYGLERSFDSGDDSDMFRPAVASQITGTTTPSTDGYRDGLGVDNSNAITNISSPGPTITATLSNANLPNVTTASLGTLLEGQPVSIPLAATGTFDGPLTWLERREYWQYTRQVLPVPGYTITGVAQNWRAHDGVWELTLPFAFPFYDRSYTKVYVNANGFLDLHDAELGEYNNSDAYLRVAKRIAPLWDDIYTQGPGGDIYVDATSVPGRVTIGWRGHTWNGDAPLEFGVSLDQNGSIFFRYGAGCTNLTPTVGISRGEGNEYDLVPGYDHASTLTNANVVRYTLSGSMIPAGMTLSPTGVLFGTPNTPTSGTLVVQAVDAKNRIGERAITWSVTRDCNHNGVADLAELANGTAWDCDGDALLDVCEVGLIDCNGNGRADACDISSGSSSDIDGNGVPDECSGAVTTFCFGSVGSPVACPCGNNAPAGSATGCVNSLGSGAGLQASGVARVSADTLLLRGTGMPNSTCLYYQGTTAGTGAVFGDGVRCVATGIIRLGTKMNAAGQSEFPGAGDPRISVRGLIPAIGGSRAYQTWYRNSATFCTSATFNMTNGVRVVWAP